MWERVGVDHTADNGSAERSPEIGALTTPESNRNHTGNQGDSGHHDGPEPDTPGFDQGLTQRGSPLMSPLREIDQQNGILGDNSHEQDYTDQAHDVERISSQQQRQHHADKGERKRNQNGEWIQK